MPRLRYALYRVLGNDLPPRHRPGQTYDNAKFILDHEPDFVACGKRWIVNRIVDRRAESRILELLAAERQTYIHIPFDLTEYAGLSRSHSQRRPAMPPTVLGPRVRPSLHARILYFTNLNSARNAALRDGKVLAEWTIPCDGNCIFDPAGWDQLTTGLSRSEAPFCAIPMYRLRNNDDYFRFDRRRHDEHEPQIAIRADCADEFDERYRWGRRSKLELLDRLGTRFAKERSDAVARALPTAGFVLRLFSGVAAGEQGARARGRLRRRATRRMLRKLWWETIRTSPRRRVTSDYGARARS